MDTDIQHSEFSFTNPRGYKIYCQSWIPSSPKATLNIHHGMLEHSGRYAHIAEYFSNRRYAVFALDHEGHGKSEGMDQDVEKLDYLIEDTITFGEMTIEKFPGLPHFVLGHSMGGLITIGVALERPNLFDAVVLSAPPTTIPPTISKPLYYGGKLLAKILPNLRPVGLDMSTLTRSPEVLKAQEEDPLVWKKNPTARFGSNVLSNSVTLGERAVEFQAPVLLVQGNADKIVCPQGNVKFFKTIGSVDKTMIMMKGLYHEIFNEPEKDMLLDVTEEWLQDRLHGTHEKNDFIVGDLVDDRYVLQTIKE